MEAFRLLETINHPNNQFDAELHTITLELTYMGGKPAISIFTQEEYLKFCDLLKRQESGKWHYIDDSCLIVYEQEDLFVDGT